MQKHLQRDSVTHPAESCTLSREAKTEGSVWRIHASPALPPGLQSIGITPVDFSQCLACSHASDRAREQVGHQVRRVVKEAAFEYPGANGAAWRS